MYKLYSTKQVTSPTNKDKKQISQENNSSRPTKTYHTHAKTQQMPTNNRKKPEENMSIFHYLFYLESPSPFSSFFSDIYEVIFIIMAIKSISRTNRLYKLWSQVSQNICHHLLQTIFRCPSPITPCLLINKHMRPTVGNKLSQLVRIELNLKVRFVFFYLIVQLQRSELHRVDVVACSDCKIFRLCIHQLKCGGNCIFCVDHVQRCVLLQIAGIFFIHHSSL